MHDGKADGAGYFVGYESVSHRRVGFIGLSGFRHRPVCRFDAWIPVRGQLAADFSQWSSLPVSIYSGSACRWARIRPDGSARSAATPGPRSIRQSTSTCRPGRADGENRVSTRPSRSNRWEFPFGSSYGGGAGTVEQLSWCGLGEQIQRLNRNHQVISVFTIPTARTAQTAVSWYEIGDGRAIAEFHHTEDARRRLFRPQDDLPNRGDGTIRRSFRGDLANRNAGALRERRGAFSRRS